MEKKVTDEMLYNCIYHWKFEDNLSWSFCSGILKQNYGIEISTQNLKRRVLKYIDQLEEKDR